MRKSLITKRRGGLWARLAAFMVVLMMTTAQVNAAQDPVKYIDANGKEQTINSYNVVKDDMTVWGMANQETWYVVRNNMNISSNVECSGEVHLILMDGCELYIEGAADKPGIEVTDDASLAIYGQAGGTGTLYAIGHNNCAGIGGGNGRSGSNIIINGGTVTATGGESGAGIGGGLNGAGSYITINGGIVTATGGKNGAAIGGGEKGSASIITINGGTVTAVVTTVFSPSAIGNGYDATTAASNIYINPSCVVKAGADAASATVITNTGADLASTLAGKKYVNSIAPMSVTVNSTADDGSEGTLRWALEQDNDKIVFDKSLDGQTIKLNSTLTISKTVTIDASALAEGITLDGQNACRIMRIAGVTDANGVNISSVKFINAYDNTNGCGGAIDIHGEETTHVSSVVLTDCVFQNDMVYDPSVFGASYGGAVYSEYCDILEFNNCLFTGNSAVGKQDAKGGAVFFMYGEAVFNNCTLTNNSVNAPSWGFYVGSAIYANNEASCVTKVTLNNTIVVGNTGSNTEIFHGSAYGFVTCNNVLGTEQNWSVEGTFTKNSFIEYDAEKNPDGLFVDAANGDYHIVKTSQAYNAGNNSYNTGNDDLDGNKRVMYDDIDLGAYEYQYAITPYTGTFDGQSHDAVTVETLESGATASYIVNGTPQTNIPKLRDAGEHSIIVIVKREGYKDYTQTVTCNIERATVTITNVDTQNKTYDAKTAAQVTYTATGIISGTSAQLEYFADFENKNADDGKAVDIRFYIDGPDYSNYEIVVDGKAYEPEKDKPWIVTTTDSADIEKAELTVEGTVVLGKTYDGNATATVTAGTLQGIQSGESGDPDDVSIDTSTGMFDDGKDAGEDKDVTVVYTLTGNDANNYTVRNSEHQAKIEKRGLWVSGTTINDKFYDGTTVATVETLGTLMEVVEGETVTFSLDNANFNDKNVGTDKTVIVYYILGGDASVTKNYEVHSKKIARAADIILSLEVTTLNDIEDPADGVISLREAITYANDNKADNETITFAEGLEGTITLTSDLPKVKYAYDINGDKRITIDGNGHTIFVVDGPLGNVIGTAENPVVFDGLTITGGIGFKGGDNRYGGAVFANCAYVTVKNSIISGNTATYGAGICGFSAATLAVTNSTFTGNNSSDKGGALYFGNNVNNSATLVNNTIVGNTASSGAAIYSEGTGIVTTYNNLVVCNGTSISNQLSGMSFTEGGCNYMTMDATSVFKNALPTGSGSWLTWIPELVSSNKDVVNAGSEGEIVKSAFGVAGDDWTGVVDNYGNPRIGEPTYHIESRIDIGSYESSGLTVTVLRNRPYGTVEITNGTPEKSEEYMVTATFDYGMKAKLTAIPSSEKYSFVWWSAADDTTQVVSYENPCVFDVVKDTTLKAVFAKEVAVNIYANSPDGGEVKIYDNVKKEYLTEEGRQHIKYGTSVTIEAKAFNESGFAFAGWFNKATGEYFSKTQKFTFDAKENLELEAKFTDAVIWVRVKKGN